MWIILVFIASLICCTDAWSIPKPPPSSSSKKISTRNDFIHQFTSSATLLLTSSTISTPKLANAAPPFAIMQEELGYFPIKDDNGETYMVPTKIKRKSTDQAISLAKYLSKGKGATMYGAYWCPHCQRQKELFGYEAFQYINYIECSPKGYKNDFSMCINDGIEGYPTWKFSNGESVSGEMELVDIAKKSGYKGKFDDRLEKVNGSGVPPIGGGACAE